MSKNESLEEVLWFLNVRKLFYRYFISDTPNTYKKKNQSPQVLLMQNI